MSTGDWELFLGPLEWARAETGAGDRGWWSTPRVVVAEEIPRF